MTITGMAFTLYPVSDIDRAIAFYRDTLGIPLGLRAGNVYAEFVTADGAAFGVCRLREDMLAKPEFPMNVGAPGAGKGFALEVDDLPAAIAEIAGKGIAVRDITDTPVCRMTTIDDPDGNTIIIHHRHAPEDARP
jgi:catechol 2,3-dioxygenase-like lactoylglutathione lyase family enzyme